MGDQLEQAAQDREELRKITERFSKILGYGNDRASTAHGGEQATTPGQDGAAKNNTDGLGAPHLGF